MPPVAKDRLREKSSAARGRRWLRTVLMVVIYPWLLWRLSKMAGHRLGMLVTSKLKNSKGELWLKRIGHAGAYGLIGFPLTFVGTSEILISLNEALLGEQANYRLRSDFSLEYAGTLDIPGPDTPEITPVSLDDAERYHQYLVEPFAPVILQKTSHRPEWDIPVFLDFDGDEDPRNNVGHAAANQAFHAGVYGELTAETDDAFYLAYTLYHLKDYDHPVRQVISRWTYHDNDNEGWLIRVEKKSMQVTEVEAWFHNRFFLCNRTGHSSGTEPVQGKAHFEDGTHLILYAQSMGHGVRCAQSTDLQALTENLKILRFRANRQAVAVIPDDRVQLDATYDLRNFDRWYAYATGPLGEGGEGDGIFTESIPLGRYPDGRPLLIGRFIAGQEFAVGSWSRPKPMWSWGDGWDKIPIFVWHFFPSYAIESHMGISASHTYHYNRPVLKTFGMRADELLPLLDLNTEKRGGEKWHSSLERRGDRLHVNTYGKALLVLIKKYVNYLFNGLS